VRFGQKSDEPKKKEASNEGNMSRLSLNRTQFEKSISGDFRGCWNFLTDHARTHRETGQERR